MKYNRWITCTPVAFRGDEKTFFSRDSGLCCRALQALGAQAKVVMPEPAWDDEPDVLRVPYAHLSDPEFWRGQGAEAVILYSWAHPKYLSIARAIKSAGLKLFLNIDTGGLICPFVEPFHWFQAVREAACLRKGFFRGMIDTLCRLIWQCIGLHVHYLRLAHMSCADAVGVVSPIGAERVRKYARFFHRDKIVRKVHFVPHPADPSMKYSGVAKQEQVIAVGRWEDVVQKRPETLIDVAAYVLTRHSGVQFVVVGKDSAHCVTEILKRVPTEKHRVFGHERLEHDELCRLMSGSQISLCTSRFESYHIASAEALLCGCTVVAPLSPELPSMAYFVDGGRSGRLSKDDPASLGEAILLELESWKSGTYEPLKMSFEWREKIVSCSVVKQMDRLLFGY